MFLDRSSLLPPRIAARSGGLAVAELAGQSVIFLAGASGPNQILTWSGSCYHDHAPPFLADTDRDCRGAIAADFDGDGCEELYLVNEGPGTDRLIAYRRNDWIDLLAGNTHLTASRAVAALDRRGHGRYAFAIGGNGGPLRLLECTDGNAIVDLAPALGIDRRFAAGAAAVAPLASQRPDLFCASIRGANALYRNTGLGTFLEVAVEHGLHDPGEVTVAATIFDDGAGGAGLILANADGPHRLFVRRDGGTFRNIASPAMAFPCDTRSIIAADFDNDGSEEILFVNRAEPSRLFRRSADTGRWSVAELGELSDATGGVGAAVADFDGDGRLELLVSRAERPPLLLHVAKNGHAWLRVRPRTRFGAPARGATVRVMAGGRVQFRTICGGSGSLCQMEPVAHFGLGTLESVDRFEVVWPDGTLAAVENPTVRTTVDVHYPGA